MRYAPTSTRALVGLARPRSGRFAFNVTGAPAAPVTMVMKSCVRALGIELYIFTNISLRRSEIFVKMIRRLGWQGLEKLINDTPRRAPDFVGAVGVIVDIEGDIVGRAKLGAVY